MVPFYKRLERLVHIELADLVQHMAYLDPRYPKAGKAPAPCAKKCKSPCIVPDCVFFSLCLLETPIDNVSGAVMHTEIFPFVRFSDGKDVDKIVGDIMIRWSKFCKTCY